jgi:septum formation protein
VLVLASASPRRQELLRNAGIEFVAHAADIAEIPLPGELPRPFAERLAKEKALKVFERHPEDVVLGADTIVVVDGEVLGKPRDHADAARMLRLLSGRKHEVITGVCLAGWRGGTSFVEVGSETTTVTMARFSEDDVRGYVATGEPMDKAGAYAIQGRASRWIPRIEGDYFNVVGLPISLVCRMLKEYGVIA